MKPESTTDARNKWFMICRDRFGVLKIEGDLRMAVQATKTTVISDRFCIGFIHSVELSLLRY